MKEAITAISKPRAVQDVFIILIFEVESFTSSKNYQLSYTLIPPTKLVVKSSAEIPVNYYVKFDNHVKGAPLRAYQTHEFKHALRKR